MKTLHLNLSENAVLTPAQLGGTLPLTSPVGVLLELAWK